MSNVWKRMACLMLSGVLLLNSVPMGVLAAEGTALPTEAGAVQTQPAETTSKVVETQSATQPATEPKVVETQPATQPATEPKVVETQPATQPVTELKVANTKSAAVPADTVTLSGGSSVAGENADTPTTYAVEIKGIGVTPENAADVFNDGKVSYNHETKTLTLKNVTLTEEAENVICAKESLTIVLEGKNKLVAKAQNKAAILVNTGSSLTIEGEGTLEAVSEQATAIHVFGAEDENGNKSGLTIAGDVSIHAKTENTNALGIESPYGVVIGDTTDDKVHLNTNIAHSYVNPEDETDMGVYTLPDGYVKNGEGEFVEWKRGSCMVDKGAFEFISANHLEYVKVDDNNHALSCKTVNGEDCIMKQQGIAPETHAISVAAVCGKANYCDVCNDYHGEVNNSHSGQEKWEYTEEKHTKKYDCCDTVIVEETQHNLVYDWIEGEAVITQRCEDGCGFSQKAFEILAPEDLTWNNEGKEATLNDEAIVNASIQYFRKTEGQYEAMGDGKKPVEPGTYRASVPVTVGEGETPQNFQPCVEFTIHKKSMDGMQIAEIEDREYTGSSLKPSEITVKDGESVFDPSHYVVSYSRKAEDSDTYTEETEFINAGTIQVTVTAKEEDPHYTGSISTTFEITKAMIPDDAYVLEAIEKNPVYDGQVKSRNWKYGKPTYQEMGYGEPEVAFYQTVEGTETKVEPIDAGTYTVKIIVADSQNYHGKTLLETEKLTIDPADVGAEDAFGKVYQDSTVRELVFEDGSVSFESPSFTGYTRAGADSADQLTGIITYTYDDDHKITQDSSDIEAYLNDLLPGKTVEIQYTFKPENPNYTGETKPQTISAKKRLFEVTAGEHNGGPETIGPAIVKQNPITYGDKDIVDVSKIVVNSNGQKDSTVQNFTVKYAMKKDGVYDESNLLSAPNAGEAKFIVYYNNADLGGEKFENKVVATGEITVNQAPVSMSDTNKPKARSGLVENGSQQELITAGKLDQGPALEYSLSKDSGYNADAKLIKASEPAAYNVWYRSQANGNYETYGPDSLVAVIAPKLTAKAGETLGDLELPEGWTLYHDNEKGEPAETKVEKAKDGKVYLSYTPVTGSTGNANVTGYAVPLTVEYDEATVTLASHVQHTGKAVEPKNLKVQVKGKTLIEDKDYTVVVTNNINPGYASVTVKAMGDYHFTDVTEKFVIYDSFGTLLSSADVTISQEMKNKGFTDKDKIKAALNEELDSAVYPTDNRKYYNFAMKDTAGKCAYDEFYWPDDEISFSMDYPTGTSTSTKFTAYGIYTVSSDRWDAEAGEIRSVKVSGATVNGKPKLRLKVDGYTAVCLAWQGSTGSTATYQITGTSATPTNGGTVTFTVGTDTTPRTSAVVKLEETVTVLVKENVGYELSKLQYVYQDGTAKKEVTIKENSGKYTFSMPSKNISIKAVFEETTSPVPLAKNPDYVEGQAQELITAAKAKDGYTMKYWLETTKTEPTANHHEIKATLPGAYLVHYQNFDAKGNPDDEKVDPVIATIRPVIKATYGQKLKDVELPDGFSWNESKNDPEKTSVGNAGINKFYVDFAPSNAAARAVNNDVLNQTEQKEWQVDVDVAPKEIEDDKLTVTAASHAKYTGSPVKLEPEVKLDGTKLKKDDHYTLEYSEETTKPGMVTVTVKGKNYAFENKRVTYWIYKTMQEELDDSTVKVSDDLKNANYTKTTVKEKLEEKFDKAYPEINQSYIVCAMENANATLDYSMEYWPEEEVTYYLDYPEGTDKNDTFVAFMMRTVTTDDADAGDIEELELSKVAVSGVSKLKITLSEPAIVAFAYKAAESYSVKTASASNGTVKFTVGDNTSKKTQAEVEVDQLITVHATPNSNYSLTKVQYTYKDGSTTKAVTVKQNDDGDYTFTMPARDITIKATFSKKTTTSKNPYSGDTSRIGLWISVMAASAVGIAVLAVIWFRKRRK